MNQELLAIVTKDSAELQLFWVKYFGPSISAEDFRKLSPLIMDEVDQELIVHPGEREWSRFSFKKLQVVHFRQGVTDNPAHSFQELLKFSPLFMGRDLKVHSGVAALHVDSANAKSFNPLIEASLSFLSPGPKGDELILQDFDLLAAKQSGVEKIQLQGLSPSELSKLSNERFWALSEDEMLVIQKHFGTRAVTDVEIEILAQTWSEHCKHKIFGATIDYEDANESFQVNSLFKTYIQKPTEELSKKKDWLISVFKDNAGIVRFHENVDLCIKVETHNSPSALDPYGGALTGILGVNRDILGTGLGARPIANTNVLLFGNPEEKEELPAGLLHPREILKGVHHGIQDGGNKSGIPTVNGAILFDESFSGKPLVFCGTVGVLPRKVGEFDSASKNQRPGDQIVMIGGAVGLDGIHGATSSSLALDAKTPSSMVQIGDPLTQKRMADFMLEARDLGLYNSLTDNGAGGLSSSIGEMAAETNGARVYLDQVPLKYPGLLPWQIFVSESQERMTLSVPKEKVEALKKLAAARNVDASVVGEFTGSGNLEIFNKSEAVGSLSLAFLHDGLPKMKLKARWNGVQKKKSWKKSSALQSELPSFGKILEILAADPSLASKEKWVRQYDHEVQAATVVKPFEGLTSDTSTSAPNDGGVIWMGAHGNLGASQPYEGAVVSSGIAPDFSHLDTAVMAIMATDEAVRNALVTGANPSKIALIDNFCWPDPLPSAKNPDAEHKLAELVRTARALSEVVRAYEMPLVSGKDSMKNDFYGRTSDANPVKISVLPTLLVTALAHHPDVRKVMKPHAKSGDALYLLGTEVHSKYFGTALPKYFKVESETHLKEWSPLKTRSFYDRFYEASLQGLMKSAHDLSEGGLLFAIFESLLLNNAGLKLEVPTNAIPFLFNETPGRILVSVSQDDLSMFESAFELDEVCYLGDLDSSGKIMLTGDRPETIEVAKMGEIWRNSL